MSSRPLTVVQWTTGKVATQAITAILERPALELVGVYAFSKMTGKMKAGFMGSYSFTAVKA